jgi:hypothetical protein
MKSSKKNMDNLQKNLKVSETISKEAKTSEILVKNIKFCQLW